MKTSFVKFSFSMVYPLLLALLYWSLIVRCKGCLKMVKPPAANGKPQMPEQSPLFTATLFVAVMTAMSTFNDCHEYIQ